MRWRHRARAIEAAILLVAARALVAWVPFGRWRPWVGTIAPQPDADRPVVEPAPVDSAPVNPAAALTARRIGRAVDAAAARLPFDCRCLPRAMAAAWMLQWRSIPATILLGVLDPGRRGGPDDLHAWVMSGDDIIVGEGELSHAPILVLHGYG